MQHTVIEDTWLEFGERLCFEKVEMLSCDTGGNEVIASSLGDFKSRLHEEDG